MIAASSRNLAMSVAASAALHAILLYPVRLTGTGPAAPQRFFSAQLVADKSSLPESGPRTASQRPAHAAANSLRAAPVVSATPLLLGKPVDDTSAVQRTTPSAHSSARVTNETALSAATVEKLPPDAVAEIPEGMRLAATGEASMRVRQYEAGADNNPNESMALDSGKYFYFNAPILKQPTQPLIDAHIHYPTTTLRHPHGAVVLLVFINEQGELEKASTLCANPAFEDSARASIQGMKFVPARDATGPVKSFMIVEYSYGSGAPCGPLPPTLLLG